MKSREYDGIDSVADEIGEEGQHTVATITQSPMTHYMEDMHQRNDDDRQQQGMQHDDTHEKSLETIRQYLHWGKEADDEGNKGQGQQRMEDIADRLYEPLIGLAGCSGLSQLLLTYLFYLIHGK